MTTAPRHVLLAGATGLTGRKLLAFTRAQMPDEMHLRCVRENEKAWRWYVREDFVFEKQEIDPSDGFLMKYYRWKRPIG